MSWKDKYRVVGIKPGKVHTRPFGTIDFSSDHVSIQQCEQLVNEGFPYLEEISKSDKKISE